MSMLVVSSAQAQKGDKKDASVHVWDPESGVIVRAYRGGVCVPRGLHASKHLLLAGQAGRPAVHAWLTQAEQLYLKVPLSDAVACLAATQNNHLCAVGTKSGGIYVWEIATGHMLAVRKAAHLGQVSTILFSLDGAHLITASNDATVKVWRTSELVGRSGPAELTGTTAPARHTWSDHSLPVTDVFCGYGGFGSRVVTASKDCSCKLYELASGALLRSFAFEDAIRSVTMDPMERFLYAGANDGAVYTCGMVELDQLAAVTAKSGAATRAFLGHRSAVTCLAVSMDACTLLSGSDDGTVRVWDTESRQCTRTYEHSDPVTNLAMVPESWITTAAKDAAPVPMTTFSRKPHVPEPTAIVGSHGTPIRLISREASASEAAAAAAASAGERPGSQQHVGGDSAAAAESSTAVEDEVAVWRNASESLYQTAVGLLMQPLAAQR